MGILVVRGRQWLQFSVRTLMLVTLLCGVGLSWYLEYLRRPRPLALDGYCPVTIVRDYRWQRGRSQTSCMHQGQQFRFVGSAEQALFEANPDKYAPACAGQDVVSLVDEQRSIRGKAVYGVKYKKRIYLFETEASLKKFFRAPVKYEQFASQKYSAHRQR